MLVWSVYMPTADRRGPDLEQMNRVVDLPDDLARVRLGDGSARLPNDEELAAYREQQAVVEKADEVEDLTKLTKAELLELAEARGVDADESMTKAKIAKAIEDHTVHAGQTAEPAGVVAQPTVVTDMTDPHRMDADEGGETANG